MGLGGGDCRRWLAARGQGRSDPASPLQIRHRRAIRRHYKKDPVVETAVRARRTLRELWASPDHSLYPALGRCWRAARARVQDRIRLMALIGVILLIGIVKKNAIVMVDFAGGGRARAVPRR